MKLRSIVCAALLFAGLPLTSSSAAVFISANFAPPPLPVVVQPPCPVDGYLWNPGYWAYGPVGYYWVPGFWTAPPAFGLLWTPPWWGFANGVYVFHRGYWGPRVGFYGGINYGFGYFGSGFYGGQWVGNVFRYNTAVTRVNTAVIKNVYVNKTVVRNSTGGGHVSFNGGPNGVKAVATAQEKAAEKQRRSFATSQQISRQELASKNPDLRASVNKGHPNAAAINEVREAGPQTKKSEERTAATGKVPNKAGTGQKVETGVKKESAARNEADLRKQEQARAAAQREDAARNAAKRNADIRAQQTRARESELARRRMSERSRRPDVVAPREANNRSDNSSDQQRKRKKRNQDSENR